MSFRNRTAAFPVDNWSIDSKKRENRAQNRARVKDQILAVKTAGYQALHNQALRDQVSELNAKNSPLLRLPAEIRNMIYTYVIAQDFPIQFTYVRNSFQRRITPNIFDANVTNLHFVSRQVYAETAVLPYKLNTFRFFDVRPSSVAQFLQKRTKPQMAAMFKLIVVIFSHVGMRTYRHEGAGSYWAARLSEGDFERKLMER